MNTFLVGNGFDLHHQFPTNYLDFLHTIQFLIKHYGENLDTVEKVFGSAELKLRNGFISACNDKHARIYELTHLSPKVIDDIVTTAKNNLWFNYLCQCVSKDIRWIDFEKEILRVLEAFSAFFDYENELSLRDKHIIFDLATFPTNPEDRHIISQFNYFFEELEGSWIGHTRMMQIKSGYYIEKVVGSDTYHLATEEIIADLFLALRDLANVLRLYLLFFVDAPSKEYAKLGVKPQWNDLPRPNYVYSFNYSNTFEILHANHMIDHLHGNTNTNIVLGINSDKKDYQGSIDTTFLQFKKYFQRVFYKTDLSFLSKMRSTRATPGYGDNTLYVIGHSLDSTDEDIIKQIFETAKTIIILYHSDSSVKNQIKNLVEMYGKKGLDELRDKKNLQFKPQSEIEWISPEVT